MTQVVYMDGQNWVPKSDYDIALSSLAEKQRSTASHNRYFAHIIDLYQNLPHHHASAPYAQSAEAFRKHGLISSGHCDTDLVDAGSADVAVAMAPVVAKHARKAHGYALVTVRGSLITCSTPHSQSFKAMGKDVFHKSVADVENWAEALIGVTA